jgi:RHS repeat-associated protein
VTNINTADGNTTYQYNSHAVEVTDVNGVQRITQTDALGRVAAVCEVSGSDLQGDPRQPCNLNIAGTGYLTIYAYDLANHKTTITQGVQQRVFQTDSLGRTIKVQEPESGTTNYSYAYNSIGLVVTRTRPKANQYVTTCQDNSCTTTTTTQYDSVGRPVSISYSDQTQPKYFSYDTAVSWWQNFPQTNLKGKLAYSYVNTITHGVSNWTGTLFSYDNMGRIVSMAECLPTDCGNFALDKHLSYVYDLAGNLTSASDGANVTTSYMYSPAGEIQSISSSLADATHPGTLVSSVTNTPFGPVFYALGNGHYQESAYDSMGRRRGGWVCDTNPSCPSDELGFTANWKGTRLTSSGDTMGRITTYGYDEFNRLKSMSGSSQSFTYTYDRYGNRLSQTVTSGSGPSPTYNVDVNTNRITTAGFSYDAAGNLINDGTHSYGYDAEGNVLGVDGGTTYTYNALNQRVRIDGPTSSYEYVFNASGQRVSTWNANTHAQIQGQYYWGNAPLAFYAGGSTHFQHQDWLGTERLRTSYNGSTEGLYASLPFGDGFSASGTDNDPYHFAQLDHDSENPDGSGTEHAQFRQYSSASGRWLSPDPYMGSYNLANPQSLNRYAYAGNNPLRFVDPLGLDYVICNSYNYSTSIGGGGGGGGGGTGGVDDNDAPNSEVRFGLHPRDEGTQTECVTILTGGLGSSSGSSGTVAPVSGGGGGVPTAAAGGTYAPNNSNKKYHCDLFGTCYRGPAIITKQAQCQQEALKKNAVALGLDIAGVGAGFLPGGDLVVAGAQAGVSAASAINSSVHGDGWGTAGGVLGVPASFAGYAAKFVGTGAKAIPGVGSAISAFGALNDAYATYSDYQACMARP